VELPKIDEVQLSYIDQWFSNLVDKLNYDISQIESSFTALHVSAQLTNIDTVPIQYLKDSLNKLVKDINKGFDSIKNGFDSLDDRIKKLGG
jgi:hypothetical protein